MKLTSSKQCFSCCEDIKKLWDVVDRDGLSHFKD